SCSIFRCVSINVAVFPVGSPGLFVLLPLVKSGGVPDNNISFLSLSISFLVSWYEYSSDSTCLKVPGLILVAYSSTTSFVLIDIFSVHRGLLMLYQSFHMF